MFSSKATRSIAEKDGGYDVLVDLKLDPRLKPVAVSKSAGPKASSSQTLANGLTRSNQTYAIGSGKTNDNVYYPGDLGLFGCVFEAWKNHWMLRTRPDDWWFPIACHIAKAVDKGAKADRHGSEKVRALFVSHEGKENIAIKLPVYTIYEANYEDLFEIFSSEIEDRIKVPEFAKAMQNNFNTSGSTHKVTSQINLMASVQEFFSYEMMCCGCGLRGLELSGNVDDWENLPTKLERLRAILKPICRQIGLYDAWWDFVLDIFQKLAETRKNPENPQNADFWINILVDTTDTKYVGGGGSMPGKPVQVQAYDGWLVRLLTNQQKIFAADLQHGGSKEVREKLSGINQVPMQVSLTWCNPPVKDAATLVAGIVGYSIHKGEPTNKSKPGVVDEDAAASNPSPGKFFRLMVRSIRGTGIHRDEGGEPELVPSVEPHHMWAMMLPLNSPVRGGGAAGARKM